MSEFVQQRREDDILVLTLNVPERRNAICMEMRQMLLASLRKASADKSCRAVVLTGAGGNFSSGGDIKPTAGAASGPDPQNTKANIGILQDIVRLLAAGPKPTVVAVEGYAYGAGFSLAAACDHVVVGPSAKFCAAFGKVGLMADAGLLWSLPQRVGAGKARDIMMTARVVDAREACDIGLADVLAEEGGELEAAVQAARQMAKLAPLSIASMKTVLARGAQSLETVLSAEADLQPMLTMSQDYVEGRAAFRERRAPVFRGV